MKKKPKKTPEDRAADREIVRQLEQRIAYHEASWPRIGRLAAKPTPPDAELKPVG